MFLDQVLSIKLLLCNLLKLCPFTSVLLDTLVEIKESYEPQSKGEHKDKKGKLGRGGQPPGPVEPNILKTEIIKNITG